MNTDAVMSKYDQYRKARAGLGASIKAAVFSALEAADITSVFVEFDGEGDSGQSPM